VPWIELKPTVRMVRSPYWFLVKRAKYSRHHYDCSYDENTGIPKEWWTIAGSQTFEKTIGADSDCERSHCGDAAQQRQSPEEGEVIVNSTCRLIVHLLIRKLIISKQQQCTKEIE
jgi:hypothetical protein